MPLLPTDPSGVTIQRILTITAHAGFAFAIALLALVAIPFVGLSTPFGLVIALLGVQMVCARKTPWLPKRAREHVVAVKTLQWLGDTMGTWSKRLERFVKPRLSVLVRPPLYTAVGLAILFHGLGLALPLPIPGSNWIFIFPILIYALGLLEDDGLVILVGHVITVVQIVLAVLFWSVIQSKVVEGFTWVWNFFF